MADPRVRWIPIGELAADVTLAADLSDPAGRVLLPAGTQLTGHLLASLQRRGIEAIPVAAPIAEVDAAAKEERIGQLRQHLDWLFHHAGQEPITMQLQQVILDYQVSKIGGPSPCSAETDS